MKGEMMALSHDEILRQEFCFDFTNGMMDRMVMGFYRYGSAQANVKTEDLIALAMGRIQKYQDTGNTEHLMDAANFLMLEYQYPKADNAQFMVDHDEQKERPSYYDEREVLARLYKYEGD